MTWQDTAELFRNVAHQAVVLKGLTLPLAAVTWQNDRTVHYPIHVDLAVVSTVDVHPRPRKVDTLVGLDITTTLSQLKEATIQCTVLVTEGKVFSTALEVAQAIIAGLHLRGIKDLLELGTLGALDLSAAFIPVRLIGDTSSLKSVTQDVDGHVELSWFFEFRCRFEVPCVDPTDQDTLDTVRFQGTVDGNEGDEIEVPAP